MGNLTFTRPHGTIPYNTVTAIYITRPHATVPSPDDFIRNAPETGVAPLAETDELALIKHFSDHFLIYPTFTDDDFTIESGPGLDDFRGADRNARTLCRIRPQWPLQNPVRFRLA